MKIKITIKKDDETSEPEKDFENYGEAINWLDDLWNEAIEKKADETRF